MKLRKTTSIGMILISIALCISTADAGFGDLLNNLKQTVGIEGALPESKIIDGLKEALYVGTEKTVKQVASTDGYYKNPEIKIPLPETVRKVEKALKMIGFGEQVESFELSMNRAAEKAAPQAKAIFWEALKQLSFEDAQKILDGADDAATRYFEEKTGEQLEQLFKPIIENAMDQVAVTRNYQALESKVKTIPFASMPDLDLNRYVTDRAITGLFHILAEEERKIRTDPASRVTTLLKEVFGK